MFDIIFHFNYFKNINTECYKMARQLRFKLTGCEAWYHITSRVVGKQFLLNRKEKNKLLHFIKHFSSIYFVEVINFSIMSNHFHLLVKFNPCFIYSRQDVLKRIEMYKGRDFNKETGYDKYFKKLGDLSEYVRDIKLSFSRWYNQKHNRWGHFWGERFSSVLFEPGEGLLKCMAYIDLNPVKAGITESAETYKWCGAYYRFRKKEDRKFLSFSGAYCDKLNEEFKLKKYSEYLYLSLKNLRSRVSELVQESSKIFTRGRAVGSKEFLKYLLSKNKCNLINRNNAEIYPVFSGVELFSINRFIE